MDIRLHVLPQRGLGRGKEFSEIARRVERGKFRVRLPKSRGDTSGSIQVLLLSVQLFQPRIKRALQRERSRRKRFDRIDAQAERPQQLHAQQHIDVGL